MLNEKALTELCVKYRSEAFIKGNDILINSPRKLSEKETYEFKLLHNEYNWNFVESPKSQTIQSICNEISEKGASLLRVKGFRRTVLEISTQIELDGNIIDKILNADGFFDTLEIKHQDVLLYYYNQYLKEEIKPLRDTNINEDDIINLRIALNSPNFFKEIL